MKLLLLLSTLFLMGCVEQLVVRNVQIRTDKSSDICIYQNKGDCATSYKQISNKDNYRLYIIEIDDQGHFYDRKQINQVLTHIRSLGQHQDIMMFVHGWHHNALLNDANLMGFRELLSGMSQKYNAPMTGVYIAWRGESVALGQLKLLSFWDRKNVSHSVGLGALPEFLLRVEKIAQQTKSRLTTIGHSLGASVVYSALKNILLQRITLQDVGDETVGYGDLVLLLNPAFEATEYAPFREIVEEKERNKSLVFTAEQKPRLIMATSDKDTATKISFPMSRVFATALEDQNNIERLNRHGERREYSQFEMDKHTIGHFKPYQTHKLLATSKLTIEQSKDCSESEQSWIDDAVTARKKKKPHSMGEGWYYQFDKKKLGNITMRHISHSSAYNPYWNILTDGNVIPSHNEVLNGNFLCFLGKILGEKGSRITIND